MNAPSLFPLIPAKAATQAFFNAKHAKIAKRLGHTDVLAFLALLAVKFGSRSFGGGTVKNTWVPAFAGMSGFGGAEQ
jgi:hypothetical protein